jgi:hypothetical protein
MNEYPVDANRAANPVRLTGYGTQRLAWFVSYSTIRKQRRDVIQGSQA